MITATHPVRAAAEEAAAEERQGFDCESRSPVRFSGNDESHNLADEGCGGLRQKGKAA